MTVELEYVGNEREEAVAALLAEYLLAQADAMAWAELFGLRPAEPAECDLRADVEMPSETRNRPVQTVSLAVQTSVSANPHVEAQDVEICPLMQNRPFPA
jgi:hypothetical protein